MQKFIYEQQTMTVNKTKKSCNIMQDSASQLRPIAP